VKVGVLAVQGDFAEHQAALRRIGQESAQVRLPRELDDLDGLIIPGGESTTFAKLMDFYHLRGPITQFAQRGAVVWGTCAGLIMMARALTEPKPTPMGLMDITVERNAFGRQVDSFEADLPVTGLGTEPLRAIFIRAPAICEVGPDVEVLAKLPDGRPVAVRQGNLLGTAFHPELGGDSRMHRYFLDMAVPGGMR
jgi:5'-phosphate synthase pdxT subunit